MESEAVKEGKKNSRKSVTWSAVPDAPKLVYVGMRLWEGQRPQREEGRALKAESSSANTPKPLKAELG